MSDIEREVRLAVDSGQRVLYEVTPPIYAWTQRVPVRIQIHALGQVLDKTGLALDIDRTIENIPRSLPTFDLPPLVSEP